MLDISRIAGSRLAGRDIGYSNYLTAKNGRGYLYRKRPANSVEETLNLYRIAILKQVKIANRIIQALETGLTGIIWIDLILEF